jgi:hypothetical protein
LGENKTPAGELRGGVFGGGDDDVDGGNVEESERRMNFPAAEWNFQFYKIALTNKIFVSLRQIWSRSCC